MAADESAEVTGHIIYFKKVQDYDTSSVRVIVCGAAPLGAELEIALKAR